MAPRTALNSGLSAHRPRRFTRQDPEAIPEDATTVDALLEWVGEDRDRAQRVLTTEQAQPEDDQRVTLVEPLQALLAAPPEGSDEGVDGSSTGSEGDGGTGTPDGTPDGTTDPQAGVQPDGTMTPSPEVPAGMTKVADLQGWVGTDGDRAAAVYDAEVAKPKKDQRSTLIAAMEQVMADANAEDAGDDEDDIL